MSTLTVPANMLTASGEHAGAFAHAIIYTDVPPSCGNENCDNPDHWIVKEMDETRIYIEHIPIHENK